MAAISLGILLLLKGAVCTSEYNFNGVIRNFAIGNSKVFVVTDSQLHQMRHDLVAEKVKAISSSTDRNAVNILLPFEVNGTLITCGTLNCGYCEVLNISDITQTIYREDLAFGPHENESAVAFLVSYSNSSDGSYILMAREDEDNIKKYKCSGDAGVTLRNTLETQLGDIFSTLSTSDEVSIKIPDVKWIDGFQISSRSYLFANIESRGRNKVVFLMMHNNRRKNEMIKSLKVATLRCCKDQYGQKLVSSSFISTESSLLWMGIFTQLRPDNPENTVLAIYNITEISPENPPGQWRCIPSCGAQTNEAVVDPTAVVFKHNSMTSVAAKKKGSWTVLYIGTADGQLIKLVLDTDFKPGCAKVLYRSDDDRMVFPKMFFDPVDNNYIYIAFRNQIKRVSVSQCDVYSTLRACIGSMDPFCGWCVNTNKCCMQEECQMSNWLSMSKESHKELISFQVASVIPGEISLTLHLHLHATESLPFTCTLKAGSMDMCDNSSQVAHFPICSCKFSENQTSYGLQVTVTVSISNQIITETLTLRSCPSITENIQSDAKCATCVSAGCYWNSSSSICTWTSVSAPYLHNQDICSVSFSESNMPEILSFWPREVSVQGKNNAEIKGKNLDLVVKIRFQGVIDCSLKETPVLERSNDTLKFNIPSGNKETVDVCVVTADGRCHSNAIITYSSQPTCTGLQPGVTWSSGGRRIIVLGSNLQFVEAVIVHTSSKEIILNSNNKIFWFHTQNQREFRDAGPFTVFLRVGSSKLACVHKLSYHPDPQFTSFTTFKVVSGVLVIIQKNEDQLNLTDQDLKVWGLQEEKLFECIIERSESSVVICEISGDGREIDVDSVRIEFGSGIKILRRTQDNLKMFCLR